MKVTIYTTIIASIQKSLGKGSSWIIDSIIDHSISISKYNPLAGISYIKLPKELNPPRKRLINIQNIDDNECFKWGLVVYLNPADHNSRIITKADKDFAKRLDFTDIKFPVKLRDNIKQKKIIRLKLVFLAVKIKKNIQSMYQCCEEKHAHLLQIGKGGKNTMFLSNILIRLCMIIHYIVEENISS